MSATAFSGTAPPAAVHRQVLQGGQVAPDFLDQAHADRHLPIGQ